MEKFIIPKDYHSELNLHDTQIAIKTVKDFFQNLLSQINRKEGSDIVTRISEGHLSQVIRSE